MFFGFPLAETFFEHGKNLTGKTGLVAILNRFAESVPRASLNVRQYYLDATNGNDSADGTSWDTAVKSSAGARRVLPRFIEHNTTLNVRGEDLTADVFALSPTIGPNVTFVMCGGAANKTVVNGPHVADIATAGTIGLSTLSLTPDDYRGYMIEIVSGPAAGNTRIIQGHDGTTFTPTVNFSATPTGSTFRIYRPATRIDPPIILGGDGEGIFQLQNMTLNGTGTNALNIVRPRCGFFLSSIVSLSGSTFGAIQALGASNFGFSNVPYNPTTFATIPSTQARGGVGMASGNPTAIRGGCNVAGLFGSSLGSVDVYESSLVAALIGFGTRIKGKLDLANLGPATSTLPMVQNFSGYASVRIDSSASVGIKATNSYVNLTGPISIENNTTHGIESINSVVEFLSAVGGSGNGGAGYYGHLNSVCLIKAASAPTLTGSIPAEVSIDGTTQASTWAAIAGGTPVVDSNEFTIVKAV